VNISWHPTERVFIAEFSSDFQGDLTAVKEAGFKPLGVPPPWIWHAPSVKALNKLREKRPASGLTITPEALEVYKPLAEAEAKNDVVKAQLAEQKKELKKKLQKEQKESTRCDWLPVGKEYLSVEDLPAIAPFERAYAPPPPPDLKCRKCSQPIYFYEQQNPPLCLWCETQLDLAQTSKIKLDNTFDLREN
jgi:hypothetical protein